MLFNSIDFAVFLPVIFFLYWYVFKNNLRLQNLLIVVASYLFYGWWDYRFLSLLIISTTIDYLVGRGFLKFENQGKRKLLLVVSIITNLGLLGFFKYYNFFLDSFTDAFSLFGRSISGRSLNIILPVGISFYTFQTLSYSIDVFRRKLVPTRDFVAFAAFVSFFPQLVAGPIERATNLLPQFYIKRSFNYTKAVDGMRQILWGLFKKMVIADNCAEYVNMIFGNSVEYSGSTLVLGAVLFTIQVYGDFSGYSDIAIGTSRIFGFSLMRNFAYPFFSRDIAEFWRRWHISLSTWFRDYLYIPLGGSRGSQLKQVGNIFILFVVSGFWHGASWNYVIWGAMHAVYFFPLLITGANRKNIDIVAKGKTWPTFKEFGQMVFTFSLLAFSLIIFRSVDMRHAVNIIAEIFSPTLFTIPEFDRMGRALLTIIIVILFIIVEWHGRERQYAIEGIGINWSPLPKYATYYTIVIAIFLFGGQEQQFIYFQF
jgi:D-alanyl-lipoteichoic acid acyltransferase DltB (MBOAT superfamily)